MKRSQINRVVADAIGFIADFRFALPPFAFWNLATWHKNKEQAGHLIGAGLGWDVTDHGQGDFSKSGLVLFTIRNGNPLDDTGQGYAEKLMVSQVGQVVPFHYHKEKTEDIINRGGGLFKIEVCNSTVDGRLAESDCKVFIDGQLCEVKAGAVFTLEPGSSIHIPPGLYHKFWSEDAPVLIGEVSTVNDDLTDNYFLEEVGRFPIVDEDEPIKHLLVSDYEKILKGE
ncbi:MAG: D-lyxose ketol-isomerase [Cellvibrionaceae bacterium]|jgi:D-lyxose ketol-isomerase